jgi:hypothetical protein
MLTPFGLHALTCGDVQRRRQSIQALERSQRGGRQGSARSFAGACHDERFMDESGSPLRSGMKSMIDTVPTIGCDSVHTIIEELLCLRPFR